MIKKTFEQMISKSDLTLKEDILTEYSKLNSESANDERLLELISVIIDSPFSVNSRKWAVWSIISNLKEGNERNRNITERLQSIVPQVKTIINTPGMDLACEDLSIKLFDNDSGILAGLLGIISSLKEQDIKTTNDVERVSTKILLTSLLVQNNKLENIRSLWHGLFFDTRDKKSMSFDKYSVNNRMFAEDVLDLIEEKGGLDNFLSEYSHIQSDKIIKLLVHYVVDNVENTEKEILFELYSNFFNKTTVGTDLDEEDRERMIEIQEKIEEDFNNRNFDLNLNYNQKKEIISLFIDYLDKSSQKDRKIIVDTEIKHYGDDFEGLVDLIRNVPQLEIFLSQCIESGQYKFIKHLTDGFINELDEYNTNVPDNRRFNFETTKDVLKQSIENIKTQEGSTLAKLSLVKILEEYLPLGRGNTTDVSSTLDDHDITSASRENSITL